MSLSRASRCGAGCCSRPLTHEGAGSPAAGGVLWVLYRGCMGAVLQLCKLEPGKTEIFPKPGNTETFSIPLLAYFPIAKQEPHAFWIHKCLWSCLHHSSGRISVPSQRRCCPACGCRPACPAAQLPAARAKGSAPASCNGNPLLGGWFTPCSLRQEPQWSFFGIAVVRGVRKTLAGGGRGECLRHGPTLLPAASTNSHSPVWKGQLGWPTPLLAAPSLCLQELKPSGCLLVAGSSVNCPPPAAAFWPGHSLRGNVWRVVHIWRNHWLPRKLGVLVGEYRTVLALSPPRDAPAESKGDQGLG